ncbi:TPM domain-containing protein [Desulfobacterota bacterium M19]
MSLLSIHYCSRQPGSGSSPLLRRLSVITAGFLLLFVLCGSALALKVPAYHGYVNDYANMISPAMEAKITQALRALDRSDSTQVAILTVPTLAGDNLEEFSIRVAEKWGIGVKSRDNGVLLLAVKNDRRLRIEVGRGLEPKLTDLLSGRIVDNIMTPYFKAGRYDDGFAAGINAIIQVIRGQFKGGGRLSRRAAQGPSPLFKLIFFGLAVTAFMGSNSKRLGMVTGALLLPLAFFFGLPSVGFILLLLLIPVGALGGWLLPLLLLGLARGGGGYYGGGMGGFGGGGGGFGGFGGGGFSGGGASGGW